MIRHITASRSQPDNAPELPTWLETYTTYALYGLIVGVVLGLFSLFTTPVPDPSFPWYSLPAHYRLPVTEPRIEHWPVSYSVAIWLWIVGAPAVFLRGYTWSGDRELGPTIWLAGLPTAAMISLTTYCRFLWPKPSPPTWNAPSYTIVCWLYCSTYNAMWSNLAYVVAFIGLVAFVLSVRRSSLAVATEAAFGILALPLGLPAVYDAYRRSAGLHT